MTADDVARKYLSQLTELKCNSKPLINSLTMMAEDYIKHATIIVQTIEGHLRLVKPDLKLPILYLIDSIVKNVKKEYLALFTERIVQTFADTFSQVSEKVRSQMWRLRGTWNEVFPTKTLYLIDYQCHQIDAGWPVSAPKPGTTSIHVNPDFLRRALHTGPAVVKPHPVVTPVTTLSVVPSISSVLEMDSAGDMSEAQMREQLLLKEKELLELRTKKLELELLQAKAKLEEKTRKQVEEHNKQVDAHSKQTLLLQQVELAKHQTGIATSLLSMPSHVSVGGGSGHFAAAPMAPPLLTDQDSAPDTTATVFTDPRRRREAREPVKQEKASSKVHPKVPVPDRRPPGSSPMIRPAISATNFASYPTIPINVTPPHAKSSAASSSNDEVRRRETTPEKVTSETISGSRRSRLSPAEKVSRFHSPPPSSRKSASPTKEPSVRMSLSPGEVRKRKHDDEQASTKSSRISDRKRDSRDRSASESDSGSRSGSRHGSSSSNKLEEPSNDNFDVPSKRRRKKSGERSRTELKEKDKSSKDSSKSKRDKDHSKKDKSSVPSGRYGRSRGSSEADETGSSSHKFGVDKSNMKLWEARKRDRDDLNARKSEVLKKSYKRKPADVKTEEPPSSHDTGSRMSRFDSAIPSAPLSSEDVKPQVKAEDVQDGYDFRTVGDIDLRPEIAPMLTPAGVAEVGAGPVKEGLIDDLFGREDVDLRAQPPHLSGTTWSQIKKSGTRTNSIGSDMESSLLDVNTISKESESSHDEDIRKMLQSQARPLPAISPANSIDSNRSTCDALGRPFLYNRLPDDPMERKRSLDQRSTSIDPVEKFRIKFIERPSTLNGGDIGAADLKKAVVQAKLELDRGELNREQHEAVMRQLMQINEINKIREVQKQQERGGVPGPNPWADATENTWNQFPAAPMDFNPNRFPGNPSMIGAPTWGSPAWQQPRQPVGPNPFEEAAAAAAVGLPPMIMDADMLPPANMQEVELARKDTSGTIPIDDVLRHVRFYGNTAIVLQGPAGDEPREISFRKNQKNVFVDDECVRCFIGKDTAVYMDRKKHFIRLGAPTRELYIDNDHYEARFGGPPIRVYVGRYLHNFRLEGPPPQVEVGRNVRFDLLAGRVNLFVDGMLTTVYLDEKPQLIDLGGFVVILRFCDAFSKILLNGRPFVAEFGGRPWSVSVPGGKHYLRLGGLTPALKHAMDEFVTARERGEMDGGGRGRGGPRGRNQWGGGRGNGRMFNGPVHGQKFDGPDGLDTFGIPNFDVNNPLDMLADYMPADALNTSVDRSEHSYEIDKSAQEEHPATKSIEAQSEVPLNVEDLLSKLIMAGILPAPTDGKDSEADVKPKSPVEVVPSKDKKSVEVKQPVPEVKIPPIETVDVSWDKLKKRRPQLIAGMCTGVQCGLCGLRYPPDQNVKYSQHLDWHFRQNRREKSNAKKAVSRKWYYDLSDWIQFAEIDDLEDRAQSLFETQENDMEADQRSPGTVLNPDMYTVLSAGHEEAICPGCNEGFDSFYDEDKEEWRLRDAHLAESEEPGLMKLYHPICHQDVVAALNGKSTLMDVVPEPPAEQLPASEPMETDAEAVESKVAVDIVENVEADDDEVLIIKEGKPEPVVMDIDICDDEEEPKSSEAAIPESVAVSGDNLDNNELNESVLLDSAETLDNLSEKEVQKDSDNQNSGNVCIDDENYNSSIDIEAPSALNNKTEEQLSSHASISSTNMVGSADANNILHTGDSGSLDISLTVPGDNSSGDTINSSKPSFNPTVNIISSLNVSSPITIIDEDTNDSGLSLFNSLPSDTHIFDIALGGHQNAIRPDDEESQEKRIVYSSMKFDVPTPIIKSEPIDPDELKQADEEHQTLDDLINAHTAPVEDIEDKAAPENIDLTVDDEETSDSIAESAAFSALDGNMLLGMDEPSQAPQKMMASSKIKIRIADAFCSTSSQSPKGSPARIQESSGSPKDFSGTGAEGELVKSTPEESSSPTQSEDGKSSVVNTDSTVSDETKRLENLKPRFVGRKLVNYPPKQCGKETSGLCTIC